MGKYGGRCRFPLCPPSSSRQPWAGEGGKKEMGRYGEGVVSVGWGVGCGVFDMRRRPWKGRGGHPPPSPVAQAQSMPSFPHAC